MRTDSGVLSTEACSAKGLIVSTTVIRDGLRADAVTTSHLDSDTLTEPTCAIHTEAAVDRNSSLRMH